MLFETETQSFSEFVLAQRLALARRMLTDPRWIGRPISAIAFDAGFADLSHFNRTFRRCFGATPSEIRARAARWRLGLMEPEVILSPAHGAGCAARFRAGRQQ
jgi:AraC-like DNA-binding protein